MWFFVTIRNTWEIQLADWFTEPTKAVIYRSQYTVINKNGVGEVLEASSCFVWSAVWFCLVWIGAASQSGLPGRNWNAMGPSLHRLNYPAFAFQLKFWALFLFLHARLLIFTSFMALKSAQTVQLPASIIPPFSVSSIQECSSAPCAQTSSTYALASWWTNLHINTKY